MAEASKMHAPEATKIRKSKLYMPALNAAGGNVSLATIQNLLELQFSAVREELDTVKTELRETRKELADMRRIIDNRAMGVDTERLRQIVLEHLPDNLPPPAAGEKVNAPPPPDSVLDALDGWELWHHVKDDIMEFSENYKADQLPRWILTAISRNSWLKLEGAAAFEPGEESKTNNSDTHVKSAADARERGWNLADIRAHGFSARTAKEAQFTCPDLRFAGYSASEAKDAGFTLRELKAAGYLQGIREAKFTAREARLAKYDVKEIVAMGFRNAEMRNAGISCRALVQAGVIKSVVEACQCGYTVEDAQRGDAVTPWCFRTMYIDGKTNQKAYSLENKKTKATKQLKNWVGVVADGVELDIENPNASAMALGVHYWEIKLTSNPGRWAFGVCRPSSDLGQRFHAGKCSNFLKSEHTWLIEPCGGPWRLHCPEKLNAGPTVKHYALRKGSTIGIEVRYKKKGRATVTVIDPKADFRTELGTIVKNVEGQLFPCVCLLQRDRCVEIVGSLAPKVEEVDPLKSVVVDVPLGATPGALMSVKTHGRDVPIHIPPGLSSSQPFTVFKLPVDSDNRSEEITVTMVDGHKLTVKVPQEFEYGAEHLYATYPLYKLTRVAV